MALNQSVSNTILSLQNDVQALQQQTSTTTGDTSDLVNSVNEQARAAQLNLAAQPAPAIINAPTATPAVSTGGTFTKLAQAVQVFSSTSPTLQIDWTTFELSTSAYIPSSASAVLVQVQGSGYATANQAVVQTRENSTDVNVQTVAVGPNATPGTISNSSFVNQALIWTDGTGSFDYIYALTTGGTVSSTQVFYELSMYIIGYVD